MTKTQKAILGAITILPLLLFIAELIVGYLYVFIPVRSGRRPFPYNAHLIFAMALVTWTMLTYYIIHMRKSSLIPPDNKSRWLGLLWGGNVFAMPYYWYRYIWK